LVLVVAVAFLARYLQYQSYVSYFVSTYGSDLNVDRIGESYHRWVMDVLTIYRAGLYSDFQPQPNQSVYWLPFYNVVSILAMLASGVWTLNVSRIVSAVAGTLTPAVVVIIGRRLYNNLWHAAIAGLVAATLPWFVDYSLWGVPYALAGFLLALSTYAFITERPLAFGITAALAAATAYEAWVVVFVIALLAYEFRGWQGKKALHALGPPLAVVALWSLWSAITVGSPVGWVMRYLAVIGWHFTFNSEEVGLYLFQLLVPTFFLGLVAVLWGLYKGQLTRILALSILAVAAVATVFHVIALDGGSPARLLPVYPILAALVPPVFPALKGGKPRKTVLIAALLIWLIIPQLAIISQEGGPLPKKAYIIMPEYRTGLALKDSYKQGKIISDSAIVMYYSGLRPDLFISSKDLDWYPSSHDNSRLDDWLKANNVQFIVWENSTSSGLWQIFPELSDGSLHQLGPARLTPIYEDTLAKRHQQGGATLWEHDFPGTPDLIIYQVQVD
jgi:hypothetical protein